MGYCSNINPGVNKKRYFTFRRNLPVNKKILFDDIKPVYWDYFIWEYDCFDYIKEDGVYYKFVEHMDGNGFLKIEVN